MSNKKYYPDASILDELVLADVYEYSVDGDGIFNNTYALTGEEMLTLTIDGHRYNIGEDYDR